MNTHITTALMLIALSVSSVAAQTIYPIFSSTYLWNGIWTVQKDGSTFGYAYGEQDTLDVVESINTTGGCLAGCTNPPYPPCVRYQVVQADHETWQVWSGTNLIGETNSLTDTTTMRDSLRMTHGGGICRASR